MNSNAHILSIDVWSLGYAIVRMQQQSLLGDSMKGSVIDCMNAITFACLSIIQSRFFHPTTAIQSDTPIIFERIFHDSLMVCLFFVVQVNTAASSYRSSNVGMNILLPVSPCWPVQAVQPKLLAIPSPPNLFS